jgi:hypothetical protein
MKLRDDVSLKTINVHVLGGHDGMEHRSEENDVLRS